VESKEVSEWNDLHMLVPVQLDPYMLIEHLCKNATYEEIMDFIIAIDEAMVDWDFTKMIISYAKEQKRLMKAEMNERY
jgi:hypothetical protein